MPNAGPALFIVKNPKNHRSEDKHVSLFPPGGRGTRTCLSYPFDTMTIGTFNEQIERTKQKKEDDLVYYGIVLFGDWDKVSELTRKFSLWK